MATSAQRSSRKTSARKPTRRIEVGVIAAAGKGTRAYPRTSFIPKPLFQFEKETILQRNVALQFEVLGVKKLFIIVGHLQEQVILEIERIRKLYPDREIEIAQWTKQGLAADVNSLRERIQGDFVLILGDEFYYQTNHRILKTEWQKQKKADALIAVLPSPLISEIRKNYSVLLRGTRVQKLVEKPQTPPNDLLGLGTYVFT
ncbi:MAG: sugar pyrophosphorylase, partial [Leptospiraceae bacterium]|nr:sugar pyrophosphorylase [Leptospiraceae bacterium]